VIIKKLHKIFFAILFVLISVNIKAQPQFPCNPGFECPPQPAPCVVPSDCIPAQNQGGPVGESIPLDGASTILLIVGIGIIGGRKIAEQVKQIQKAN